MNAARRDPWWRFGSVIGLVGAAGVTAYLFVVAARLTVDTFDSYEAYLDAHAYLGRDGAHYLIGRDLVFPALFVPVAWLGNILHSPSVLFVAGHLFAVGAVVLLAAGTFCVFRLYVSRHVALVGSCALAINPIVISNAPLFKEDILGTALLTWGLFLYLKGRRTGRLRLLIGAGAALGLLMVLRYVMLGIPLVILTANELVAWGRRALLRHTSKTVLPQPSVGDILALFVWPAAIVALVVVLALAELRLASPLTAAAHYAGMLTTRAQVSMIGHANTAIDIRNLEYLVNSVPLVVLALAVIGAYRGVRARIPGTMFFGIWFVVLAVVHQLVIADKEARYLIALLPPLYFFFVRGVEALAHAFVQSGIRASVRKPAAGLLVAGITVSVAFAAAQEALRLSDPLYTTPFESRVAQYSADLVGGNQIHWSGNFYPLHPKSLGPSIDDPYSSVYHFYSYAVVYWTGRQVDGLSPRAAEPDPMIPGALALPDEAVSGLADGDVIVCNPYSQSFITATVPATISPMTVERVRVTDLDLLAGPRFVANDGSRLSPNGDGAGRLSVSSAGARPYHVYLQRSGQDWTGYGEYQSGPGGSELSGMRNVPWAEVRRVRLITYESPRTFSPPA